MHTHCWSFKSPVNPMHFITGAVPYAALHKHLFFFFCGVLPQSPKSKSIFLSCVSRVTNWGLKPLQFLSRRISQSCG